MKPIRLSMTAFGPYKEKETIDFTKLQGNQIFVISGATGAGKTTIFDGICFALYGSVSGEERENAKTHRSNFATDDTHTAIELVFEMKGKTYRILRQLAHVKAGNKTATGEKTEFVEITDEGEIPVLDSHRVRDLNDRLEEIIGLTKEQFKQIVMLPQGEFRKLLTSDSRNKEQILRKIFKTEHFEEMTKRLKDKKTEAEKQLLALETERATFIRQIKETLPEADRPLFHVFSKEYQSPVQIIEGLQHEQVYYEAEEKKVQTVHAEKQQLFTEKQQMVHAAEQFNLTLEEYQKVAAKYKELLQREAEIESIQKQLKQAERAEHIIPYEQAFREQRKRTEQLIERVAFAKQQLQQAIEKRNVAKEAQASIEQQLPLYEKQKEQLREWQRILPFYEAVNQLEQQYKEQQHQLAKATTNKEQYDIQLQQAITRVKQAEEQYDVLMKQLIDETAYYEQLTQLKQVEQLLSAQREQRHKLKELTTQHDMASTQLQEQNTKLHQVEEQWLANQAYVLAEQLVVGEICPVCGNTVKEKIQQTQTVKITKEIVEQAKIAQQQAEQKARQIQTQVDILNSDMQKTAEALQQVTVAYNETTNVETIQKLEQTLNKNNQQKIQAQELQQQLTQFRKQVEQLREQQQVCLQQVNQFQMTVHTTELQLQDKKQQLPVAFATKQQVDEAIHEITQQVALYEQQTKQVNEAYEVAMQQHTTQEANVQNMKQQHVEAQEQLSQLQQQLQEKVLAAGFQDGKEYTAARLETAQMNALQEQITQYEKERYATEEYLEKQQHLAQAEKKNVEVLKEELLTIKEQVDLYVKQLHQIESYRQSITRFIRYLEQAQEKSAQLEERASQIIQLYDLMAGKNAQKISFERYLQIEYLEQIIQAANERLVPLTNGQYRLLRSERVDSNGKQSGLSLDVYDAYTGQERDVKTLSGGEQFNASLCLALGMSDIIQSFRGNVQMDTMFVDEGFGTLDEEALSKAIDTLVDLQKTGRMIGIISHVAELKETVPATLEVRKTKEGYSHTTWNIK